MTVSGRVLSALLLVYSHREWGAFFLLVCLIAAPDRATISNLQKEFKLSSEQIDCLIAEEDFFHLADLFRAWTIYAGNQGLQLNEGEQHTILANVDLIDNRMKMNETLKVWKRHNSSTATFRKLLNLILVLDLNVARNICQHINKYIKASKPSM